MKEAAKPERKDFYFKAIDGLPEFDFYKYMDKVEEYVSKLQAKHEEELKQAVVKAWEDGSNVGYDAGQVGDIVRVTGRGYYGHYFNTKEL